MALDDLGGGDRTRADFADIIVPFCSASDCFLTLAPVLVPSRKRESDMSRQRE